MVKLQQIIWVLAVFLSLKAQGFSGSKAGGLPAATDTLSDTPLYVPPSYVGLFPKREYAKLYRFGVSGFYRFFSTYTAMDAPYLLDANSGALTPDRNLFIGDDSQMPNLLLNFSGRPTEQTAWSFDVYAFQFLFGNVSQAYSGQIPRALLPTVYNPLAGSRLGSSMNLLLGMNLYGSHATEHGTFKVGVGGLKWVSLSDLTLASFRGYNRFVLFERNPWDPIGAGITERYDKFYSQGNINQDTRWGEQAFQGFSLNATALPLGFNAKLLYGKTALNGGFLTIPNSSYGGRLSKDLGSGSFVAVNTFNNLTYSDSLASHKIGFNVITGETALNYKKVQLLVEAGAGRYFSPEHDLKWGELVNAKLRLPASLSFFPVEFNYFRISQNVFNNNAIFWNTSIIEAKNNNIPAGSVGSTSVLQPFASAMTPIGSTTNNRQGLNINTDIDIKNLKLSLGWSMAGDLVARNNQISFSHPINQYTRSRFWRWNFPTGVGPYSRYNVAFRNVYEIVNLTDDSLGVPVVAKRFSTIEIQAKYQTRLMHRKLYFFMLNRYQSAQSFWSATPVFNSNAYLRLYSNQLEAYYEIRKKCILNGYLGYERNLGNYNTEVDAQSFKPLNQTGWGTGLGVDVSLGKNAGLFIRQRWFSFKDINFKDDTYSGKETLVELKLYF
ncbi:hypothetical protein GC194_03160 [bacterium]|nr:hypothetical protein [bacterium]